MMGISGRFSAALVFIAALFCSAPQASELSLRPVNTYSIVARDEKTGEMGVAVQSHWFSVGPLVVWGEAGVGVVATQSFVDPSYGHLGLSLMRTGKTAMQTLKALLASDEHPEVRQVAMLDSNGIVAAHTGDKCIASAGHQTGSNFSVQANLMHDDRVWPAMAKAFEETQGALVDRMLSALDAAQALGGDLRGKQSAAILVVSAESSGKPWLDRKIDLRVEDNPDPLGELHRLLKLHAAYNHMNQGDAALETGNTEGALAEYGSAETLFPDNPEMKFWHAVALANIGRDDEALALFSIVFASGAHWKTLAARLVDVGLLEPDAALAEKLKTL